MNTVSTVQKNIPTVPLLATVHMHGIELNQTSAGERTHYFPLSSASALSAGLGKGVVEGIRKTAEVFLPDLHGAGIEAGTA